MKHSLVFRDAEKYISFPHISYNARGEILMAFREASRFSMLAAKNGVATHHDPESSIRILRSSDHGETWDTSRVKTAYSGEWGVNDPALTLLRDGSLLLRFVALRIVPSAEGHTVKKIFSHRAEHGLVTEVVGNAVMRSADHGESWQMIGIATVPGNSELTGSCSRDPIVELPDGSWLMPVYTGAPQRSDIAWVMRSFNQGRSWQEPTQIMEDPAGARSQLHGTNFNETSLLHLRNGEIFALTRGDTAFHTTKNEFMPVGGVGELYSSRSLDGGLCWTPPQRTGIWGQPGAVIRLRNGKLLATYGYRKAPFGVRCCLSADEGRSWQLDKEIVLRDDGPTWDLGYPFSLETRDGGILTVYYMTDAEGIRHIASTRWSL